MSTWSQLFQYQARAEPVHVPAAAEDVALDKWEPRLSQPVARARRVIGTDGANLIEPSLFVVPPAVVSIEWMQPMSQPHPRLEVPALFVQMVVEPVLPVATGVRIGNPSIVMGRLSKASIVSGRIGGPNLL